ncbi:hypothetical protein [Streptomyces sp. NBC_01538]|uniref:hypothetical protein n=1 Tax=Streptomyces sp. NBC_01538 TaxID=2903897 RepID=UPI0038630EEF
MGEVGADHGFVEVSGDGTVAFDAMTTWTWAKPLRISPEPVISPGRRYLVMASLSASPSGRGRDGEGVGGLDQGDDRGVGDSGLGGLAVQLIGGTRSPVLRR